MNTMSCGSLGAASATDDHITHPRFYSNDFLILPIVLSPNNAFLNTIV